MLIPLTCEHLGSLDQGHAAAIINASIRDAIKDLEDRGKDGKSRKVVIEVELKLGEREDVVEAHVSAGAKIPPRDPSPHRQDQTSPTARSPALPGVRAEDPNQRTIDTRLAEGPTAENP